MKKVRAFIVVSLLLTGTLVASNNDVTNPSSSSLENCCKEEQADVEDVIIALSDYSGMTITYIHQNLLAFHSYGADVTGDEYGYISVETEEGPESWNWKYDGGNIMVVWPT